MQKAWAGAYYAKKLGMNLVWKDAGTELTMQKKLGMSLLCKQAGTELTMQTSWG